MIIDVRNAAMALDLQLPGREFIEGSVIRAVVRGVAGRDLAVTGGEAALIKTVITHHRQGNVYGGSYTVPTRAAEIVVRQDLPVAGWFVVGQEMVQPVALEIPAAGPGSAAGELIRISWAVRVRVQIVDSAECAVARDVVVLSRAAHLASVEQGQQHGEDRNCALLTFQDLSSRRLVPGVPMSGVLTVAPRRPVSARGVRVELVLREEVDHGPWIGDDPARNPSDQGKEKDTVVVTTPLTNRLELDPARPQRLPFAVTVPARLPAPSLRTPEFSARWILRGVLDRALHQDPFVEVELHGVTAAN